MSSDSAAVERSVIPLRLPSGEILDGGSSVVVVGPNGSGKTRQTRLIATVSGTPVEFVNALRNTRVAPELPAMGQDTARATFQQQKAQAQSQHWELTSEFDSMLSQLLAVSAGAAMDFMRRYRNDPLTAGTPEETAMSRVEDLWGQVFTGRTLRWQDWKPLVTSTTAGSQVEYSGNQMSDGEKAALYLAGRVFSSGAGVVLVVDEPETHFHSLLAVRLWNALEEARPDIRFVYITHDLTFAMSRRDARYVLASPTEGLRAIDLGDSVPDDVAEALLGSASLSFYASRVVFCEGEEASYDNRFYNAWFNGVDTVVRAVGGSARVIRCVDALKQAGLARSLEATGLVDRDYYSDSYFAALPSGVKALSVHEVESLFALPEVVAAVAKHNSKEFSASDYLTHLEQAVSESQRRALVVQRWKVAIEPYLTGLVAKTSKRNVSLDELVSELPAIFDMALWDFSPQTMLEQERTRVSTGLTSDDPLTFLALVPGKQLLPIAARSAGMEQAAYTNLVISMLRDVRREPLPLRDALVAALQPHLPPRAYAVSTAAVQPLTPT